MMIGQNRREAAMANSVKLREVRDLIRRRPALLDMRCWINEDTITDLELWYDSRYTECGLTACIGGWAALLNGWIPVLTGESIHAVRPVGTTDPTAERHIEEVAARILELTPWEADVLFNCSEEEFDDVIGQIIVGSLPDQILTG